MRLRVLASALLLIGCASLGNAAQPEDSNNQQQSAARKSYERSSGAALICTQTGAEQAQTYKCEPAPERSLKERAWRVLFRGLRDPIALLTLLLLVLGGLQFRDAVRTTRRQLRAYVAVKGGAIEFASNPARRRLRLTTENYGQTPATEVAAWRTVIFDDYPLRRELSAEPPKTLKLGADVFPPSVAHTVMLRVPRKLSPAELRAWVRGRKAFYVVGRITYRDIFGKLHQTDFRYFCTGEYARKGGICADETGNSMS